MEYNIIESGSSGNAILVNNMILLDCGVAYSKIKNIIKNVKVIFISHL
jgi:Cft2 family RNA processing exonuclease